MDKRLHEVLEDCLQAVEQGMEIEAALERHPDLAVKLRPLLEMTLRMQALAEGKVPAGAMRRGRVRLLQKAAEMRAAKRTPRLTLLSLPRRLAFALVLSAVFLLSGTGLVRASSGAIPGDNLYSFKRTWEDLRLWLAFDPFQREVLEDEFENERLEEVGELLARGRTASITFVGIVTQQNGDVWLVAGIPVTINTGTQLPGEPVLQGAAVVVTGRTTPQGTVEAALIQLLPPGTSVPSGAGEEQEREEEEEDDEGGDDNEDGDADDDGEEGGEHDGSDHGDHGGLSGGA